MERDMSSSPVAPDTAADDVVQDAVPMEITPNGDDKTLKRNREDMEAEEAEEAGGAAGGAVDAMAATDNKRARLLDGAAAGDAVPEETDEAEAIFARVKDQLMADFCGVKVSEEAAEPHGDGDFEPIIVSRPRLEPDTADASLADQLEAALTTEVGDAYTLLGVSATAPSSVLRVKLTEARIPAGHSAWDWASGTDRGRVLRVKHAMRFLIKLAMAAKGKRSRWLRALHDKGADLVPDPSCCKRFAKSKEVEQCCEQAPEYLILVMMEPHGVGDLVWVDEQQRLGNMTQAEIFRLNFWHHMLYVSPQETTHGEVRHALRVVSQWARKRRGLLKTRLLVVTDRDQRAMLDKQHKHFCKLVKRLEALGPLVQQRSRDAEYEMFAELIATAKRLGLDDVQIPLQQQLQSNQVNQNVISCAIFMIILRFEFGGISYGNDFEDPMFYHPVAPNSRIYEAWGKLSDIIGDVLNKRVPNTSCGAMMRNSKQMMKNLKQMGIVKGVDRHLACRFFAFQDSGILDMATDTALFTEDEIRAHEAEHGLQVIALTTLPGELRRLASLNIDQLWAEMPGLKTVCDTQGWSPMTMMVLLVMVFARPLFKVGDRDKWQLMIQLLGIPGVGKSLLLKLLSQLAPCNMVGILNNTVEKGFSWQHLRQSVFVIGGEVDHRFNGDLAEVQQMIDGDSMAIKVKNCEAIVEKWLAHLIFAGNRLLGAHRTQGMTRRLMLFAFVCKPEQLNNELENQIINELGAIVLLAGRLYTQLIADVAQYGNFWSWCKIHCPQLYHWNQTQDALNAVLPRLVFYTGAVEYPGKDDPLSPWGNTARWKPCMAACCVRPYFCEWLMRNFPGEAKRERAAHVAVEAAVRATVGDTAASDIRAKHIFSDQDLKSIAEHTGREAIMRKVECACQYTRRAQAYVAELEWKRDYPDRDLEADRATKERGGVVRDAEGDNIELPPKSTRQGKGRSRLVIQGALLKQYADALRECVQQRAQL